MKFPCLLSKNYTRCLKITLNPSFHKTASLVVVQLLVQCVFQQFAARTIACYLQVNACRNHISHILVTFRFDFSIQLALKIWRVPQLLWSVLVGLRSLLSVYFDAYARNYFRAKFYSVIQPAKVTLAIKLLHGNYSCTS